MEMSHQGGAEAESLLRSDHRNPVVMQRGPGWEGREGEKSPFIRNEPVKLTPAWEGSNLPNDTLNLKGITMDLAPPKDKWRLIYMTLLLHGLGTLTAWNMFITAKDYFQKYKLANDPEHATMFLVYIGYAAQLPNFLFSWFNVFVTIGGNLATRIIVSLFMEVLLLVFTVVLAMVDSSEWPVGFFWATIVSVFLMNAFNAIFQNSVYGVAARLPPQYTGAVVLGSNVCGTLVAFLQWASEYFGGSYRTSAIYYFIAGMLVLLICFDTYFALPLNRFFRYHSELASRALRNNPALADTAPPAHTPWSHILKTIWPQLYNVFIVFFVTLAVFPAVQSDIKPLQDLLPSDMFMRVTCFLTFNVMAMIGCITANIWPYPTPRWLVVFTSVRIVLIPLFLSCNYHPLLVTRTMPVLVRSDALYWLLAALLAWSSGHGSSLAMMYVSRNVEPEHASKAGMIGGAMLVTGILSGIAFSGLGPLIVTMDAWKTT